MDHSNVGLDCATAMKQLWDYLDGELSTARIGEIRAHLDHCATCLPHARFSSVLLEVIAKCRDDDPMPSALRTRVLERLRDEGFGKGAGTTD